MSRKKSDGSHRKVETVSKFKNSWTSTALFNTTETTAKMSRKLVTSFILLPSLAFVRPCLLNSGKGLDSSIHQAWEPFLGDAFESGERRRTKVIAIVFFSSLRLRLSEREVRKKNVFQICASACEW
jgi:hypothetical protein